MSIVVYTALFGQYDELLDQPVRRDSNARFVCFTDDPRLRSDSWEVQVVEPAFRADPVRSARLHKILGPVLEDPFDVSIWIDASVRLRQTPERLVEEWLPPDGDMALCEHSYREQLLDEFDEIVRLDYDDRARVYEQLTDYAVAHPEVLARKPLWTGVIVRRNTPAVARGMRVWADHVLRYSRRDQLSILVALTCDLRANLLQIDNFDAPSHEWPVIPHRRIRQGKARMLPAGPLVAELRRAKLSLADAERRLEAHPDEQIAELTKEVHNLRVALHDNENMRVALRADAEEARRDAIRAEERLAISREPGRVKQMVFGLGRRIARRQF